MDVFAVDEEVKGFAVESCAVALGANGGAVELICPFAGCSRHFAVAHLLDITSKAFVGDIIIVGGVHDRGRYAQITLGAVDDFVEGFLRHVCKRCVEVAVVFAQQCFELPEDE